MMPIERIATEGAPAAIGPYSQGVRAGDWIFLSGQIPLDPASGELVPGGIEAQTRQVMRNLRAVLAAAGLDFAALIKTTIYLVDLADFAAVNTIYGEYFPGIPPARATLQVAGLPRGSRIEIEGVVWQGR
jgi:2-iminobutanoate/2-iminopropanoate deaminase